MRGLSPTLAAPPLAVGALRPPGSAGFLNRWIDQLEQARVAPPVEALDSASEALWSFMPYTSLANSAGLPSMSVPLHWSRDGLPIGVMFTGRYGDEAGLLRLAAQLETARPWANRLASTARHLDHPEVDHPGAPSRELRRRPSRADHDRARTDRGP